MIENRFCPVCLSQFTLYVHDIQGYRTKNKIPQYFCMNCNSFWNFSGYHEDDATQFTDYKYLVDRQDHISKLQNRLLHEINSILRGGVRKVLEVGCGTGLFLKACQYNKIDATGFEINKYAAEYAIQKIGVNVINDILDARHSEKYDLAVAIGVLEHLEKPRDVFSEMVSHLNPGGAIYINVPFVEKSHWKYLLDSRIGNIKDEAPHNPFYDNDVHIVHFSIDGLKMMGHSLGARSSFYWSVKDVISNSSMGSYQGVLFYF